LTACGATPTIGFSPFIPNADLIVLLAQGSWWHPWDPSEKLSKKEPSKKEWQGPMFRKDAFFSKPGS
jgi:hypothetical protein